MTPWKLKKKEKKKKRNRVRDGGEEGGGGRKTGALSGRRKKQRRSHSQLALDGGGTQKRGEWGMDVVGKAAAIVDGHVLGGMPFRFSNGNEKKKKRNGGRKDA